MFRFQSERRVSVFPEADVLFILHPAPIPVTMLVMVPLKESCPSSDRLCVCWELWLSQHVSPAAGLDWTRPRTDVAVL